MTVQGTIANQQEQHTVTCTGTQRTRGDNKAAEAQGEQPARHAAAERKTIVEEQATFRTYALHAHNAEYLHCVAVAGLCWCVGVPQNSGHELR